MARYAAARSLPRLEPSRRLPSSVIDATDEPEHPVLARVKRHRASRLAFD